MILEQDGKKSREVKRRDELDLLRLPLILCFE